VAIAPLEYVVCASGDGGERSGNGGVGVTANLVGKARRSTDLPRSFATPTATALATDGHYGRLEAHRIARGRRDLALCPSSSHPGRISGYDVADTVTLIALRHDGGFDG